MQHKPMMYLVGRMKEDGSITHIAGIYKSSHWAKSHWDYEWEWQHRPDGWIAVNHEWPKPCVIEVAVIDG